MELPKSLEYAVAFASFAKRHDVSPRQLAELVVLVHRSIRAGVKEANAGSDASRKSLDAARLKVEDAANRLGWCTSWSAGLTPVFNVDSRNPNTWFSVPGMF
jgi:hypothetical protein